MTVKVHKWQSQNQFAIVSPLSSTFSGMWSVTPHLWEMMRIWRFAVAAESMEESLVPYFNGNFQCNFPHLSTHLHPMLYPRPLLSKARSVFGLDHPNSMYKVWVGLWEANRVRDYNKESSNGILFSKSHQSDYIVYEARSHGPLSKVSLGLYSLYVGNILQEVTELKCNSGLTKLVYFPIWIQRK